MTENNSATGAHTDTSYMIFPETDSGNAHINEARTNVTGETNPLAGTNAYPDNWSILVDLDGDGDLDLVVWSWYDNFVYFKNTGTTGNTAGNRLEGSAGDDMLHGGPGNDTLYGGEGDDLLQGGPGADNLNGGPGQDTATYADSPAGVTVHLHRVYASGGDAAGDTFDDIFTPAVIDEDGDIIYDIITTIENLTGSAFDDNLAGDPRGNVLAGGDGNDILDGRQDNDTLYGGEGDDLLQGGPGADNLNGGPGQDTATYADSPAGVTVHLHRVYASGGDAAGDTFDDIFTPAVIDEDGDIIYDIITTIENLTGSAFDDNLAGDPRGNVLAGGDGNDILDGRQDNDTLYGGWGHDQLFGGAGNDTLYGGEGDDRLVGGAGNDLLIGGPGSDVYVFEPGDDDIVIGFTNGEDKLDLSAFELVSLDDLTITAGDYGVTIDLTDSGGGTVLLVDVLILPDTGDYLI